MCRLRGAAVPYLYSEVLEGGGDMLCGDPGSTLFPETRVCGQPCVDVYRLVPHLDETFDVMELLLCICPTHDTFVDFRVYPVQAELDIRNDIDQFRTPVFNIFHRERPVSCQVHLDIENLTQIYEFFKMGVQQWFTHGRGDDFS